MAYFPFMVDIENKNCLVVGGGRIALHKIKILLGFGVHIHVVAEEICQELKTLQQSNDSLEIVRRQFQDGDITGMDFVVAATDDETINYHISDLCRQNRIPINAVDMKDACSFIFPAIIQEKDLLIAISSGGQSPAASAYVKHRIQRQLPDYYGEMIDVLGEYREFVLAHVDTAEKRKKVFQRLLEYGDAHNGEIPEETVYKTVDEIGKK